MEFNIDLTTIPEIKPIPSGVYILRVLSGKVGKSQSGNDKITWETEIVAPDDIAKEVGKFYFSQSLSENALFRVKQLYQAAGCLHPGSFSIEELIGCEIGVDLILEKSDQWGVRNNVQRFFPASKTQAKVSAENKQVASKLLAEAEAANAGAGANVGATVGAGAAFTNDAAGAMPSGNIFG